MNLYVSQRPQVSLFGALFVFILACIYWKWVLLAIALIWAGTTAFLIFRLVQAVLRERREAIEGYRRRAAEQDAWIYQGDPRGMYGHDMWKNHKPEDYGFPPGYNWRRHEGQIR